VLLVGAILCLVPGDARGRRIMLLVPAPLLPFLPLGGVDLAGTLYGHLGAISLPGLVLLYAYASRRLGGPDLLTPVQRDNWQRSLLLLGLLLYPMALGLGAFDPYALGFKGPWLPLAVSATAVLLWFGADRVAALVILAALWCWQLEVGESNNLYDYLIDVWTLIAAFLIQAGKGVHRLAARRA
jgi:hypothetical protein